MTIDRAARATRAPLNRERVLRAAVALADTEGIAAVTMRRVAAELGVEAMSLYHHLPGKADLLDGLVEVVASEVVTAVTERELPAGWSAEVRDRCLTARTVMLRHPWAPGVIGSRTGVPPVVYGLYEGVVAAMVRGGLSYQVAHRGLHALGSMVLGFTQELFSPGETGDDDAGAADLAAMAEALPYTTAMIATEMHDAADPTLGWCDSQTEFEFTLGLLLDGLDRTRA